MSGLNSRRGVTLIELLMWRTAGPFKIQGPDGSEVYDRRGSFSYPPLRSNSPPTTKKVPTRNSDARVTDAKAR